MVFPAIKVRHPYTDRAGYKHWRKEDPNHKHLCAKSHAGRHDARNCRRPREVLLDVLYPPTQALLTAITSATTQDKQKPFDARENQLFAEQLMLKTPHEQERNTYFNIVSHLISQGLRDITPNESLSLQVFVVIAESQGLHFLSKRQRKGKLRSSQERF